MLSCLGQRKWLDKQKSLKKFKNSIKIPSFKKEIDKIKYKKLDKWQWKSENETNVKLVNRTLAL